MTLRAVDSELQFPLDKVHLINGDTINENLKLEEIFPNKTTLISAYWFTGHLKMSRGELVNYVHMGYESEYEEEINLTVVKGIIHNIFTIQPNKKGVRLWNYWILRLPSRLRCLRKPGIYSFGMTEI